MAEIVIKIGSVSENPLDWQNGDPMSQYNNNQIKCVHAEHYCHPKNATRNRDTLITSSSLTEDFLSETKPYRCERVSKNEVKRILLSDGSEKITTFPKWRIKFPGFPEKEIIVDFSPLKAFNDYIIAVAALEYRVSVVDRKIIVTDLFGSNVNYTQFQDKKEAMFVSEFIAIRMKHPRHATFGTAANEYWFVGQRIINAARLSNIWSKIESKKSVLESDHTRWNQTPVTLRKNLVVPVNDFTDEEGAAIVAPRYDSDGTTKLMKRDQTSDWENVLSGISGDTIDKIKNRKIPIDIRRFVDQDRATILATKV